VETGAEAEALRDQPSNLNQRQPAPPDFSANYQRRALIVAGFFKEAPDTSRGIEYPQGIEPDRRVQYSMSALRDKYPQAEFFSYDRYCRSRKCREQRGAKPGRVRDACYMA
jgi:hypothetical protein